VIVRLFQTMRCSRYWRPVRLYVPDLTLGAFSILGYMFKQIARLIAAAVKHLVYFFSGLLCLPRKSA
jgi:hypothetical protein